MTYLLKMKKRQKTGRGEPGESSSHFCVFFLRERNFSLKIRRIRPSADFRARRENDLRGTGYAWTPVLESFFKLFEVGFSPYLRFIPIFKGFSMFRLV